MSVFFERFVRWWRVPEEDVWSICRYHKVDLIVAVSYTTTKNRLVEATEMNLDRARKLKENFPDALLLFCSCESNGYPFYGAGCIENNHKIAYLRKYNIEPLVAPNMANTIDEAQKQKALLDIKNLHPNCMVICTGELHGPSSLLVWKMLSPETEVLVSTIPAEFEIQPDHPVEDQRTMGRWIWSNIKRQAALRVVYLIWLFNRKLGLKALGFLGKIKHKPAR